ncbi:MAG: hypothetical protein IKJ39_08330 [Lachnospiraceae bacterium]|nr:hypothetical protein [Lachnospiraceae bacterium]
MGFWTRVRLPSTPLDREVKNGYPIKDIAGFRNVVYISIDADELEKQETPKSKYSFRSIKKWIQNTYGVTVSNSSISMVKKKCGIETIVPEATNIVPRVITDNERYVVEAFKNLGIIKEFVDE